MKIRKISLWRISLTGNSGLFGTDRKTNKAAQTVIVCIDSDSGHSGWGEISPNPGDPQSPDEDMSRTDLGTEQAIEALAPAIFDAERIGPESLMERLDAYLPGHLSAKSAIDTALWDLLGKAAGLPLYVLLGGRHHSRLPLYQRSCCQPPREMAQVLRDAGAPGQSQFRIQFEAGQATGDDHRLPVAQRAARQMLAPQSWTERRLTGPALAQQARDLKTRGQNMLAAQSRPAGWGGAFAQPTPVLTRSPAIRSDVLLEQPCCRPSECAAICAAMMQPRERAEEAGDPDARRAPRAHGQSHRWAPGPSGGRPDPIALRISNLGGLSAARRAREHCITLDAPLCIEEAWGSEIAMAAALHLGATTPRRWLSSLRDLSGTAMAGLDPDAPRPVDGKIAIPKAPGLGVSPDPDRLGAPHRILD